MSRRLQGACVAIGLALALAIVSVPKPALGDGVFDALCAYYGKDSAMWVFLGCTDTGSDPHGSYAARRQLVN